MKGSFFLFILAAFTLLSCSDGNDGTNLKDKDSESSYLEEGPALFNLGTGTKQRSRSGYQKRTRRNRTQEDLIDPFISNFKLGS